MDRLTGRARNDLNSICHCYVADYLRMHSFYWPQFSKVLFMNSEDKFSGIIHRLFRGTQNIFKLYFSIEIVVKCATKILNIG